MTAKPVPEHISDERLAELSSLYAGVPTHDAKAIVTALTELQRRREAEAGFREFAKLVDESPHPERSTHLSADARAQAAFAMLDNFKRQAHALAASPSSPASGVRVKRNPDAVLKFLVSQGVAYTNGAIKVDLTFNDMARLLEAYSALGEHP
jgi:hypothetical protein